MTLIELAGIARVFRLGDSEVHALAGIDLAVAAGEYVAVMGASGSGKSTLLNLLGLLDRPDAGSYRLEGRDVTTLSNDEQARVRRERIGFVFQSFHLVPRLTAAENVALPLMLAGVEPAERTARVAQALADFGLADRADHRPDQLSGGQRQRVGIARALVQQPELLLADEPVASLDPGAAETVMGYIKSAATERNLTTIASLHQVNLSRQFGQRFLGMRDGELVFDGYLEDLTTDVIDDIYGDIETEAIRQGAPA